MRISFGSEFVYRQVLILDEPTSGLDPNQLAEIRELIRSIGKEKTVMLSTHIMQEVQALCSRVLIRYPVMEVLNTTSPSTVPLAPIFLPVKTVPFSSASLAIGSIDLSKFGLRD